jgi:hypothetical protein
MYSGSRLPEYRERASASVAGTVAASMCDEHDRPRAECRGCARLNAGDSEEFENGLRDIADQLDERGDLAVHVEQGETGKAHSAHRILLL